jgi:hypothetical protein
MVLNEYNILLAWPPASNSKNDNTNENPAKTGPGRMKNSPSPYDNFQFFFTHFETSPFSALQPAGLLFLLTNKRGPGVVWDRYLP